MKKMILAAAVILSAMQPAFAAEQIQTQDLRGGDVAAGAIIGGVIGGIIGGAIGGGRHPHPMPPPHGGPGYPGDRQVVCYARNARGQVFRAFGWGERRTQNEALSKCERTSEYCSTE